jgi:hypothetical protein
MILVNQKETRTSSGVKDGQRTAEDGQQRERLQASGFSFAALRKPQTQPTIFLKKHYCVMFIYLAIIID